MMQAGTFSERAINQAQSFKNALLVFRSVALGRGWRIIAGPMRLIIFQRMRDRRSFVSTSHSLCKFVIQSSNAWYHFPLFGLRWFGSAGLVNEVLLCEGRTSSGSVGIKVLVSLFTSRAVSSSEWGSVDKRCNHSTPSYERKGFATPKQKISPIVLQDFPRKNPRPLRK